MYFLDNNSGIPTMPPLGAAQSTTPRWFSEGDGSKGISWPGQDWFNIIQSELLNILQDAGVRPDKTKLNQLTLAVKAIIGKEALLQKNYLSEISKAGADAQEKARAALGLGGLATLDAIVDATLTQKGAVQLSSATNSNSETLAATPKAVKAAYDLASAKFTAVDATTARKGIVQLSNATDSASELLAATPKAVKIAMDNANARLAKDRNGADIPNADLFINNVGLRETVNKAASSVQFFGQIPAGVNLNTLTNNGVWFNPANANATLALNYPSTQAGSLQVLQDAGVTQIYTEYSSGAGRQWRRGLYSGMWNAWRVVYDSSNKPSASDVGALPIGGGTLNGNLTVRNQIQVGSVGNGFLTIGDNDSGLSSSVDGQVDLWANGVFRGYWNTTVFSFTGQIIPTNYANFDAKYQAKGSYTPTGQAYTKAESDARYIQNMRLGTAATINIGGNGSVPGGCVVVGAGTDDWKLNRLIYKPIQRYINGVWATISG